MQIAEQAGVAADGQMTDIEDIVETFDLLGDWEQRYQYLIELGEGLAPMPPAAKSDNNRVMPCMSTVHVSACWDPQDPRRVRFLGDCDTAVIKGVVALLVDLLSGRTPDEIGELDVDDLFKRLRLAEHLSPNRHVGIYAIVGKMQAQAAALAETRAAPRD